MTKHDPKAAMLHCWHNGVFKPVGKVFNYRGEWVFWHEESGSQRLYNLDSPGGIDMVVVDYLMQNKVPIVFHVSRKQNVRLRTNTHTLLTHGSIRTLDGRKRIFLPSEFWDRIYDVPQTPYIAREVNLGEPSKDYAQQLGLGID